jgi:hypothetical protein
VHARQRRRRRAEHRIANGGRSEMDLAHAPLGRRPAAHLAAKSQRELLRAQADPEHG